jgi:galactokinase
MSVEAGGGARELPDVLAFLSNLRRLSENAIAEARSLFDPGREVVVARAPGRLDLMGGIADYSGSLVLQWPLREATLVALQLDSERRVRVVSLGAEDNGRAPAFDMPLDDLAPGGTSIDYPQAQALFRRDPARSWAAYVVGAFLVLLRERGFRFTEGVRLLIRSDVPEGKGVSSSAALEVAVMQALDAAFEMALPPRELAILCQKVENLVVGAPCGVMDQMAAACGREGELLALLCQPADLLGTVALPADLEVWGLDSGVRHAVSGSDYAAVRVGAFMGARILADLVGLPVAPGAAAGTVTIDDTRWNGYLANVTPSEFESLAARLPESLRGSEFLAGYGGTTDTVTSIDPARDYAVRGPAAHPVYEHFRVRAFAELLTPPITERRCALLGELMYQSHASYSACGLGSGGTDLIVELTRAAGLARGFYGAKITGGGSGGTVAILGRRGSDIGRIAQAYAAQTGHRPQVFSGSSPGAASFGHRRLPGPGYKAGVEEASVAGGVRKLSGTCEDG